MKKPSRSNKRERPAGRDRSGQSSSSRDSRGTRGGARSGKPLSDRYTRKNDSARPERGEKSGRPDRAERSDRPARPTRPARPGQPGRPTKPGAGGRKPFGKGKPFRERKEAPPKPQTDEVRLNRYIASAGICSRREADELITAGAVTINGKVVTELGTKVQPGDEVNVGGETLRPENMIYLLLNKSKDYITTVTDPRGRKTVLDLIHGACKERVYPVGRLDRATTGLLLLTNDGDLVKKLTHPKYRVRKLYHVELDKKFAPSDIKRLQDGIELDDGFIKADKIEWVDAGKNKKEIGIELHSGRNRIVRRMMEHCGYRVKKLDRVIFAGLSKKGVPRGKWRMLTEAEVGQLKMISAPRE